MSCGNDQGCYRLHIHHSGLKPKSSKMIYSLWRLLAFFYTSINFVLKIERMGSPAVVLPYKITERASACWYARELAKFKSYRITLCFSFCLPCAVTGKKISRAELPEHLSRASFLPLMVNRLLLIYFLLRQSFFNSASVCSGDNWFPALPYSSVTLTEACPEYELWRPSLHFCPRILAAVSHQ